MLDFLLVSLEARSFNRKFEALSFKYNHVTCIAFFGCSWNKIGINTGTKQKGKQQKREKKPTAPHRLHLVLGFQNGRSLLLAVVVKVVGRCVVIVRSLVIE